MRREVDTFKRKAAERDFDPRIADETLRQLNADLEHITVAEPDCVAKSFPQFWDVLAQLRGAEARARR